MKRLLTLLILPLAAVTAPAADPLPDPAEVTAAMKKAAAFYQSKLAVNGGYASGWKKDLSVGISEHHESKTLISIQPPGTTTVGLALVHAYQATQDPQFLDAARAAGKALLDCQLASGGWNDDFDFAQEHAAKYHLRKQVLAGDTSTGKRRNTSTLDDNKTQSALLFLLELAHLPECRDDAALRDSLTFGLNALLKAQYPNGAWPQKFEGPVDQTLPVKPAAYPKEWSRTFPNAKYSHFYTLNDNNMQKIVELLLRAHELTREESYLNAARKAGDFFILAQMPEPQPAWAQQYNFDMEPVWARKFEPPCISGGESSNVMRTLHELWVATGDDRYLKPLPAAFAWYERSALPDGRYARFYELQTNKPLYFVKDTYQITYDDGNLPTHYGFKIDAGKDVANLRELMKRPREELLARRSGPTDEKGWTSRAKGAAGKAARAMAEMKPEGYWLSGDIIDAADFVKNFNAMSTYVEGARKGGAVFAKLRQ